MTKKEITVVRYSYRLVNSEWAPKADLDALKGFVESLHEDLYSLGITVNYLDESDKELEVKGYADLLNIIRLRSPKDHIGNLCLGHIIGQSDNCDLFEDIRRGVSRIAFAPEMIEPEGSNKVVCHNCGCGC
jgi:hypothetical protein